MPWEGQDTEMRRMRCAISAKVRTPTSTLRLINNKGSRDALLRHCTIHGERAAEVKQQLASQATRAAKACEACAKSKQQCRGGIPCARCIKRKTICNVEPSQRQSNKDELSQEQQTENNLDYAMDDSESSERNDSTHFGLDTISTHGPASTLSSIGSRDPFPIENYLPSPNTTTTKWYQNNQLDNQLAETNGPAGNGSNTVTDNCLSFDDQFLPHPGNYADVFNFGASPLQWVHLDGMVFDDQLSHHPQPQAPLPINHDILLSAGGTLPVTRLSNAGPLAIRPCFPQLLASDLELLARDNFCGLRSISVQAYTDTLQFFCGSQQTTNSVFPSIEVFRSLAELYFEFFDHDFPCVHPQQIEHDGASWILLLAVVAVGAQYSSLPNSEAYIKCFQPLLAEAIEKSVRVPSSSN